MTYREILSRFTVKQEKPDKAQCICPAHDDRQASLTISQGRNGVLVYCHAGCDTKDVLEKAGLTMRDLFQDAPGDRLWMDYVERTTGRGIEGVYHYCRMDGGYAFSRIRLSGKDFRYGKLAKGRFTFGLQGESRENIPAVYSPISIDGVRKATAEGKTIFYCEGEKDVDTLNSLGFIAVTCGAAKDWNDGCAELFRGADAVVLADNDPPGKELAAKVGRSILGTAKSVRVIVPVPGIEKADISDYFRDHTPEDFKGLLKESRPLEPLPATAVTAEPDGGLKDPGGLALNRDGSVKSILSNYAAIMRKDYSGKIWLNIHDGRPMIGDAPWGGEPHPVKDVDLYRIVEDIAARYGIDNDRDAKMALAVVAEENARHPVVELLEGLEWDGHPRISELFPRYLGAERSELTAAITRILFYGAIQRVFRPGVKFDYCIVITDPKQGTGKSTMCRFLALKDEWFTDGLTNISNAKEAYEVIRGRWIVEMGEMIATNRAKSVEEIRGYISRQEDTYRDLWTSYADQRPRQCIFIGTSNKPQCLPNDPAGNRRFIPMQCDGDRAVIHPRADEAETREYIRQCYAEAMKLGAEEGWPLELDRRFDEQLGVIREGSTPENPDVGIIQEWLDCCGKRYVCNRMIWDEVFAGDQDRKPPDYELRNINDIMKTRITGWRNYGGGRYPKQKRFEKYGAQRAWERVTEDEGVTKDVTKGVTNDVTNLTEGFVPVTDESDNPFL